MGLILLEALLAGCVFIFIIWWTMFSGRPRGEPPGHAAEAGNPDKPAAGVAPAPGTTAGTSTSTSAESAAPPPPPGQR